MKLLFAAVLVALVCCTSVSASNYAVLVAGSNGYYNYRHQSDICHAFQVLTTDGGIPAENIIVFMYDDIATDPSNPTPGVIINHPNGTNVYPGVNKDYTGVAVTPANFLAVITGNASGVTGGSGRVLQSTSEDNVFIYFSDHGATGLIAFPSEYLYAADLFTALTTMSTKQMYKELVFYIEACESGSMFSGILPTNMSIYATTASTPDQSSYACYWDATRNAYLGDEYSVRWMEDADVHDTASSTWTLEEQFKVVFSETVQSQPQQYGDLTIDAEDITEFEALASGEKAVPTAFSKWLSQIKGKKGSNARASNLKRRPNLKYTPCGNAVDSRDVKLYTLLNRRQAAVENGETLDELEAAIDDEFQHRAVTDFVFDAILSRLAGSAVKKDRLKKHHARPRNFECLKAAITGVEANCGKFDDYSLKYVYQLVNLCEAGARAESIVETARSVCTKQLF